MLRVKDNIDKKILVNYDFSKKDELGFIDTPHPTYYLHTIRALNAGSNSSFVVFSVISTKSTGYTKDTLYNDFQNKEIMASGFYSSTSSASYAVRSITPKSTSTVNFCYGNAEYTTQTYGGTYFTDSVAVIK